MTSKKLSKMSCFRNLFLFFFIRTSKVTCIKVTFAVCIYTPPIYFGHQPATGKDIPFNIMMFIKYTGTMLGIILIILYELVVNIFSIQDLCLAKQYDDQIIDICAR
jgi:hypothetical protein